MGPRAGFLLWFGQYGGVVTSYTRNSSLREVYGPFWKVRLAAPLRPAALALYTLPLGCTGHMGRTGFQERYVANPWSVGVGLAAPLGLRHSQLAHTHCHWAALGMGMWGAPGCRRGRLRTPGAWELGWEQRATGIHWH